MPITATPLRIDADLIGDASAAAKVMSRSLAQQVSHWARIGRELEASAGVSLAAVTEVLAGRASYDSLPLREQAIVRANWEERLSAYRSGMDLAADFNARGVRYAELGPTGKMEVHEPGPASKPAPRRKARPKPTVNKVRARRR